MVKANSIIVASSGNWSDYAIDGVYITTQDFDFEVELKEFEKENPLTEHKYHWGTGLVWDEPKHMEFFVEKGLIKKLTYNEIHVNEYPYQVQPKDINLRIDANS